MTEHSAIIEWKKQSDSFQYEKYNRGHEVAVSGNQRFKNSAAKEFFGDENYTNPEELLAASLGSCHMLTFLALASKSRFVVESYQDNPTAVLEKNEAGKNAVTVIKLAPKIVFSGENRPAPEKIKELHHKAHEFCMIANSIKCQVVIDS